MGKFALLKDFSFSFKNDYESLKLCKICESLDGKIEFVEFGDTLDFITKVTSVMGNCILEVLNCSYDHEYLIQAFYLENDSSVHEKLIMVKRKIMENDTYTYAEFDPKDPKTDVFQYLNITTDDIANIIRSKYINKGVLVSASGNVQSVEYIDSYDDSSDSGTLAVMKNDNAYDIKYLNIKNIMQKSNENNEKLGESDFSSLVEKKLDSTEATYIYSQMDASIGLLNCYYETVGMNKNAIISQMLGSDICGDVLLGLENHLNDDSRILSLTPELFSKIFEIVKSKDEKSKDEKSKEGKSKEGKSKEGKAKEVKVKNEHFYNIYYELQ
jgi:hypothetical protein